MIIDSVFHAGSGHPGGSLSAVELIVTLYEKYLKFDPNNPDWDERDYFILSKGHAAPLIYSILAMKKFFPEEELKKLRKIDSILQGHPDALKVPGIEVSTGSLGQGFGVGAGIALGIKHDQKKNNVFVLIGDGELQEGSIWETAMAASHYELNNLCAIIDSNKFQIDGKVNEIMNVNPIQDKFQAFGWRVIKIHGHNLDEINQAYQWFINHTETNKPSVIIADTVKGKGVSFMENTEKWHGKAPKDEEYNSAQNELKYLGD